LHVKYIYNNNLNKYSFCSYMIPFFILIHHNYSCRQLQNYQKLQKLPIVADSCKIANNCKNCQQLQKLPTIAEVANNCKNCQQLQKLPMAAVVAAIAEKGCNSGFKLVIAKNQKTVTNTNFSE
jgi:hypothetical protein